MLSILRERGGLSRSQIAARSGLSRTTLSEITGDLLARGAIVVVTTDARERAGSGRPAELLALDPRSGQFLGVDLGHSRVRVAVADAAHEIIASEVAAYPSDMSWPRKLAAGVALVDRLTREQGITLAALQGIGVGVAGPYSPDGSRAGVLAAFADRFTPGVPVIVDNNTRFAALAEAIEGEAPPHAITDRPADGAAAGGVVGKAGGAAVGSVAGKGGGAAAGNAGRIAGGVAEVNDVLYVRLADGIGGGLVVGGRLVAGARGVAGEFGHVRVDPAGEVCRCGKRGCLETIASVGPALAAADVRDLGELAARRDEARVREAMDQLAEALGRVLADAALILNPDQIVIGGPLPHAVPAIVARAGAVIAAELVSVGGPGPLIRAARLGDDDGARGAIAACFRQSPLLDDYPSLSGSPQ
ncbi:ROK family transcriptional regulator [Actinoplanes sp. NPDC000266]